MMSKWCQNDVNHWCQFHIKMTSKWCQSLISISRHYLETLRVIVRQPWDTTSRHCELLWDKPWDTHLHIWVKFLQFLGIFSQFLMISYNRNHRTICLTMSRNVWQYLTIVSRFVLQFIMILFHKGNSTSSCRLGC